MNQANLSSDALDLEDWNWHFSQIYLMLFVIDRRFINFWNKYFRSTLILTKNNIWWVWKEKCWKFSLMFNTYIVVVVVVVILYTFTHTLLQLYTYIQSQGNIVYMYWNLYIHICIHMYMYVFIIYLYKYKLDNTINILNGFLYISINALIALWFKISFSL